MGKTGIEWTEQVWNPTVGCKRVSAGCDHCYAFQLHDQRHIAWKRGRMPSAPAQYHKPFSQVQMLPERLNQPLGWRKPRRVFVNSMSDAWHDDITMSFIARMFARMAATPQHTYQILTKRPERMRDLMTSQRFYDCIAGCLAGLADTDARCATNTIDAWPLPNVWLGVSTENQETADARIPILLGTPAAVRFLSCEPLLGPISLARYIGAYEDNGTEEHFEHWGWGYDEVSGGFVGTPDRGDVPYDPRCGLDWVIVGGESGPIRREMSNDWARSLRDQCLSAEIAFFFKQSSALRSGTGRELDGREWNEYPKGE